MKRRGPNPREVRHRVIAVLLQSGGPMTVSELSAECGTTQTAVRAALADLVGDDLVVQGRLVAGKSAPQFCWAAAWARELERSTVGSKERLRSAVSGVELPPGQRLDIDSKPVLAFHNHIIHEYRPPRDKRWLVFLQCSVRRPFSSSPSHASMRRAISTATGYDPGKEFDSCPVHVVVLASTMGPVPYEFEDVYPANVRSGGVKHFGREHYARVKPILAQRMAEYVTAHHASYDRMTTFTDGRYAEVMHEARQQAVDACGASVDFPVLPVPDGPRVTRKGRSTPRTYWEKYWIQLYLEIVRWLEPGARREARMRLDGMDVEYG